VIGRDPEIRQIIDILMRRRQNNPILTGEAGVGKTAVVEGFALRIAAGDVPEPLLNVSLRSLDMGLLQAGAGVKGEFENRLKQVIEEVRGSATPIILFIDEAHTMIGAGGAEGQNDAANLLKPALARGELRTIAATTWAEYKKYFEKDAALSRRFQVIKVEEPAIDSAIQMMRGLTGMLEKHHRVRILDEAVIESVRLSSRYIPARQLPDKCVSVLDTACARVARQQQHRGIDDPAANDHLTGKSTSSRQARWPATPSECRGRKGRSRQAERALEEQWKEKDSSRRSAEGDRKGRGGSLQRELRQMEKLTACRAKAHSCTRSFMAERSRPSSRGNRHPDGQMVATRFTVLDSPTFARARRSSTTRSDRQRIRTSRPTRRCARRRVSSGPSGRKDRDGDGARGHALRRRAQSVISTCPSTRKRTPSRA
jgi:ATP-dependent Clp protease ATP-binding subunit ClpA